MEANKRGHRPIRTASAGQLSLSPGSLPPCIFFYLAIVYIPSPLSTSLLGRKQSTLWGWRLLALGTASPGSAGARNSQQGAGLTSVRGGGGFGQA